MTGAAHPPANRVAELEARVAELTALVEQLADPADSAAPTSRRGMLKLAGAAVAGAVGAAVAGSMPAAADNGLVTANSNLQTTLIYKGNPTTGNGFLFQATNGGTGFPQASSTFPAVVAAWSVAGANQKHGVYGSSNTQDGFGVVAENNDSSGTALKAVGARGADVRGVQFGVVAETSANSSVAVFALAPGGSTGVFGIGGSSGVTGIGGFGLASGTTTKANLFLAPTNDTPKMPPPARTDTHQAGEMDCVDGDLWFCVKDGTPGTWRRISGLAGAGGFHAITPTRVYDSRGMTPGGPLAAGATRDLPLRDKVDPSTFKVVQAGAIPAGATAVSANVTVVGTAGSGFLALNPFADTTVHAATINWFGPGQILNNGVNITLGGDRQITVIAGGSGASTDFVIDVTGFYL